MKLRSISFENYKAFYEKQTIQLRPITILIGKNSSGKSSIAKLFTLLENSLSGEIDEPLLLSNNDVELGADFENLFFANTFSGRSLKFALTFNDNVKIEANLRERYNQQLQITEYGLEIFEWKYQDDSNNFEFELKEDGYFDNVNKRKCDVIFKGFIPVNIPNDQISKTLFEKLIIDVDYIGPFRVLPERCFYLTGQMQFKDTGVKGKNAYSMLATSKFKEGDRLNQKVSKWYEDHFDGWSLEVDTTSKQPFVQILLSKQDININLVDVGQGMNQALPLVVRANVTDRPESIIVLEQPELHLHPAAHGDLAELFAKSAKENNQTYIIETHSENILLRLRKLIVENDFGFIPDDLIIYWIEDAKTKGKELREITVDENGVLNEWPEGVFNESLKEILEMQNAIQRKAE